MPTCTARSARRPTLSPSLGDLGVADQALLGLVPDRVGVVDRRPGIGADAGDRRADGRAGAHFSITARSSPAVSTAIASIRAAAWTPIHYPNAVWDEAEQRLISDAEIAEVPFTAFTSRRTADHINGRLIVRRVKRLNPTAKTATSVAGGDRQGELFALYRYHAVFTDSPLTLVQAEKTHRAHAIIEQVHAVRSGPLAHLPSVI